MMQRYVEASERNDWEAATAFWADDIVVHAQGKNPLAGEFFGKQAYLEHAGRIFSELGGHLGVG